MFNVVTHHLSPDEATGAQAGVLVDHRFKLLITRVIPVNSARLPLWSLWKWINSVILQMFCNPLPCDSLNVCFLCSCFSLVNHLACLLSSNPPPLYIYPYFSPAACQILLSTILLFGPNHSLVFVFGFLLSVKSVFCWQLLFARF